MRIRTSVRGRKAGYALFIVVLLGAVAIVVYAGLNGWTNSSVLVNDRNNVYNQTLAAAEAATERVLGHITRDFLNQSFDPTSLDGYRTLVPIQSWATNFQFSDGEGHADKTYLYSAPTTVTTNLDSQFRGLYGLVYDCQVRGQARRANSVYSGITAAVQQDLQLASIPVFQFAIFYSMDLEINPGANMTVTGKVHGNSNLYLAPNKALKFLDDVGATSKIYYNRHPDDPTVQSKTTPVFLGQHVENVSSLTLPVASNNTPSSVWQILDPPLPLENPLSTVGKQRYYNACDLIVTTTDTNVTVQSGRWAGINLVQPDVGSGTNASYSFISTNNSFYDGREKKWTTVTQIDVGALTNWIANTGTNGGSSLNGLAKTTMSHGLSSIYVNDLRSISGRLTAVRVVNGQYLPDNGLTVATRLPIYVKGHFNAPDTTVGYTNTINTKPASLVGDSITVLSGNWSDANSTTPMNAAWNTTVNAAFMAGIVQTTNNGTKHYSGGVENYPRLLENWSSKSLTYNGSMVVLFPSRFATNFWVNTGTYYNAPTRKWAFDLNFLDHRKLPPATPQVRKLVRGQWSVVAAR